MKHQKQRYYDEQMNKYLNLLEEAQNCLIEGQYFCEETKVWKYKPEAVRMSKNAVKAALNILGKIGSLPKNKKEAA